MDSLTPHILGPHPGLSILRIWQGIVEVVLRITFSVSECMWRDHSFQHGWFIVLQACSIFTVALSATVVSDVSTSSPSSENNLARDSKTAGLCVTCLVSAALFVEVAILVLRFLNIGIINLHMKKFFIVVRCQHSNYCKGLSIHNLLLL